MALTLLAGCGGGSGGGAGTTSLPTTTVRDLSNDSVAHLWNEVLLNMIRTDRARPPVQARNLFHISAAMYDAWAAYDTTAKPYLLGTTVGDTACPFKAAASTGDPKAAREQAISYAAYRLIKHRYRDSPAYATSITQAEQLMADLGFDSHLANANSTNSTPSELGNYIADCYINYGLQDGANEAKSYANQFYRPTNIALIPANPGNPFIADLDRWQPLDLVSFADQAGNTIPGGGTEFVGAEWGRVKPFALRPDQKAIYSRKGVDCPVYLDPGKPPSAYETTSDEYPWSFVMVAKWSAHLDPQDGVTVDISPGAMGNTASLPMNFATHRLFYDETNGGVRTLGRPVNPATQLPYPSQVVPRGDYTRVIAEFWADGPNSETPPGHWFTFLNDATKHPLFKRKYRGAGDVLDRLEWDVKSYFALGGAMHDAAISAWGIKGWYDSIRPISAIRAMAELGQRSDPSVIKYHPRGLPLQAGMIEMVGLGDPLVGPTLQNYGKVKIRTWKGPSFVADATKDTAGVGWILAENWWPYQKATFVTPPFAGYVSGHSTFSAAAAEVLTALTGDEYFPGGLKTFAVKKDSFLKVERGPSVDLTLQWATYRDAAAQSSVSRIWGGIHPPMDDIPGRQIGARVGVAAVEFANKYFNGATP